MFRGFNNIGAQRWTILRPTSQPELRLIAHVIWRAVRDAVTPTASGPEYAGAVRYAAEQHLHYLQARKLARAWMDSGLKQKDFATKNYIRVGRMKAELNFIHYYENSKRRHLLDPKEWLFEDSDPDVPFTFAWACEQLSGEPTFLMAKIRNFVNTAQGCAVA